MSRHTYDVSKQIRAMDYPFYALIMAAMRQADTLNLEALKEMFPSTWDELQARYWAPGSGILPGEPIPEELQEAFGGMKIMGEST